MSTSFDESIPLGPQPFTIGGVGFDVDEAPNSLKVSFSQAFAKHEYIGGGRTIQSLGRRYKPISWKGQLTDTRLAERVLQLKQMLTQGTPVLLIWGPEEYTVLVTEFEFDYEHQYLGTYSMTVEVVSDNSGATGLSSAQSIDTTVQNLNTLSLISAQSLVTLDESMPPYPGIQNPPGGGE